MPETVLQTLKKQCNPLLKKSFKERNPDVDMDEIQNNPNVPEDVKAAITGAMSLALDDDEAEETCDATAVEDNMETFDDDYIMDMSDDDGKKSRRRRVDENDEDWLTGRRKTGKPRRSRRKHKKRSKQKSENGENGKQTNGESDKVKKKRVRKLDESAQSLNSTLESSTLDSTISSTLNSSFESMNRTSDLSGNDSFRKENKQKKTPKKRDSTEKPVNGIVKKTSRRQFSSISAILACIESVVQGNDASIPESTDYATVKTEKLDETDEHFRKPEMLSPMKSIKFETIGKTEIHDDSISVKTDQKPKKQPRRRSSKNKELSIKSEQNALDPNSSTIDRSAPIDIVNKSQTNGTSPKQSRTSMKKVKFLS